MSSGGMLGQGLVVRKRRDTVEALDWICCFSFMGFYVEFEVGGGGEGFMAAMAGHWPCEWFLGPDIGGQHGSYASKTRKRGS